MAKRKPDELDESLRAVPRIHEIEQSTIDGKVSTDNKSYRVDTISRESDDGVTYTIKNTSSKTCDFGHLLSPKVGILSRCERCGKLTCTTEGCGYTCQRCGRAFCRKDITVYSDGQAYCSGCRWFKHVMIFWDMIKRIVK